MITLIEETHQYINAETNEEYHSVSSVLSKFKKPFNKTFWSNVKAKQLNTTAEDIIEQWDEIRDNSCVRGKNYHKIMEDYILTGKREIGNESLYSSFASNIIPLGNAKKIHAEKLLHNDEYKIAGTADIIIDHDDSFSIIDFKTNKAFRYFSPYNEYLLAPVDHLQACEFNTYALQLSLYAYMYECLSNKKLKALIINYLNKETQTWTKIPVQYLKYEALLLLRCHGISASLATNKMITQN
jgi:hypothetical protein